VRAFVAGLVDELTKLADIEPPSFEGPPKVRPAASRQLRPAAPPPAPKPAPGYHLKPGATPQPAATATEPHFQIGPKPPAPVAPLPPRKAEGGAFSDLTGMSPSVGGVFRQYIGEPWGERAGKARAERDTQAATGARFRNPEEMKKHIEGKQLVPGKGTSKENAAVTYYQKKMQPPERRAAWGMSAIDTANLGRSSPVNPPAGFSPPKAAPKSPMMAGVVNPASSMERAFQRGETYTSR
jgi:hypothetical protein